MLEVISTMLFDEHLVVEAAGAAALAAYLQSPSAYAGQSVVLLVTGSNLPDELLRQAVMLRR